MEDRRVVIRRGAVTAHLMPDAIDQRALHAIDPPPCRRAQSLIAGEHHSLKVALLEAGHSFACAPRLLPILSQPSQTVAQLTASPDKNVALPGHNRQGFIGWIQNRVATAVKGIGTSR